MIGLRFIRSVDSWLFGSLFTLKMANKKVQEKIDRCCIEDFQDDDRLKHSRPDLDAMRLLSVQRLERIENKAMGTLLGVTVALAVFGAATGLLGQDGLLTSRPFVLRILAASLLLLAMLYLFVSGLLALRAYKVGQIYAPTLRDRVPIAEETQEKMITIYSIEQNHLAATLRANRLSAAFACIRNGLLAVLALGFLIVLVGVLSGR